VPVEVRSGRSDGNEADIHVDAVPNADDIAEQSPVLVDAVGCRLGEEPYTGAARKQRLRPQRRRPAVALPAEENLGRVDLDQTDALAIAKDDGVAVADVIDAVERRRRCDPTRRRGCERAERYQARKDDRLTEHAEDGRRGSCRQPTSSCTPRQDGLGRQGYSSVVAWTVTPTQLAVAIYGKSASHSRSAEARKIRKVARALFPDHTSGTHWYLTDDQVDEIRRHL
jgi:hypothetical protein